MAKFGEAQIPKAASAPDLLRSWCGDDLRFVQSKTMEYATTTRCSVPLAELTVLGANPQQLARR